MQHEFRHKTATDGAYQQQPSCGMLIWMFHPELWHCEGTEQEKAPFKAIWGWSNRLRAGAGGRKPYGQQRRLVGYVPSAAAWTGLSTTVQDVVMMGLLCIAGWMRRPGPR
jgi:hypothetical protein